MTRSNSKYHLSFDCRVACAALLLIFLMLPSSILPSSQAATFTSTSIFISTSASAPTYISSLASVSVSASSLLIPVTATGAHALAAPREIIESKDHMVNRFNTTVTVIDEKTVRVSMDYGFTWLDVSQSRDLWYVYVGDGAYGITTEDEKGPLNYGTNYNVENGWLPVHLRGEVCAGQSCYFSVSYYAENRMTYNGQGSYHLAMWMVWDTAFKEDVAIKVNVPGWLSVSRYDPAILKAGTAPNGGTVLSARVQNASYDTNYYLNMDLVAKQDTSGWTYVPSVSISNWTRSIMAGVPTDLILAVSNLGNGTAYLTNVTVSAPPVLRADGASTSEIGELRPFETWYLHFTANASSPCASYVYATVAYAYGNGTTMVQDSNCTIDVARRVYDSIVVCNVAPDYAEVSKEASLNYVMVPIRNTSISVLLIRPDGSLFSKVNCNITYGSFTVRFTPDVAGNWTASLEVPETDDCRGVGMNTTFSVHSTDLYSSQVLSSENKKLVASYDAEETYTFTNNGTEVERSPIFDVNLYTTLPTQEVTLLGIDPVPISLSYSYSGLRARFTTPELNPGENFTIVVRFNVKILALPPVTEDFNGTPDDIPSDFLKYTDYAEYWEKNDTGIQNLSSSLTANQSAVLGKVKAIYLWMADNIEYDYDKYNAIERGEPVGWYTAPQTLALRKGVCADISDLFITLCRASGIPAVAIVGNCYNGVNGSDNVKSAHQWAAAYVPGYGWVEVDPTWKLFGRLDEVHVARKVNGETPIAGGYHWWNVNNAPVYSEHIYLTRISAPATDGGYHGIDGLDTDTLVGLLIIMAIIAAVVIVPFKILKKMRAKKHGS